jgi:hypothetical protein
MRKVIVWEDLEKPRAIAVHPGIGSVVSIHFSNYRHTHNAISTTAISGVILTATTIPSFTL